MFLNVKAVVLREVRYKEADKILTVLTPDKGKLTVAAHGALSRKSTVAASTQFPVYSDMVLQETKNGRLSLKEAKPIEMFEGLRNDIELLALAQYICEATESVADADYNDALLMSLCLNSLWMLSGLDASTKEGRHEMKLVKAVFELRLACISGFEPDLQGNATPAISAASLTGDAMLAAEYVVSAEPRKIFSFDIPDDDLRVFAAACEAHLMQSLDRSFPSLDYFKRL